MSFSAPLRIATFGLLAAWSAPLALAATWQPSAGHTQVPLWPNPAAQDAGPETLSVGTFTAVDVAKYKFSKALAGTPISTIENVTVPTMTLYLPKVPNTGVAVVVFPGGGYKGLAIDLEGTEVCDWLTSRGITCVLLKYRVPDSGPHWESSCNCQVDPPIPLALQDAQRTLGLVRLHAAEWRIDPHTVGVMGFSAGGHLVADVSNHFEKRAYTPLDAADRESCRPDFAVALFPGHLSRDPHPETLTPRIHVTARTSPTFLIQAEDDPIDSVENSLVYETALRAARVPVEMHLFAHGGHAFGLRRTELPITRWPALFEEWLGAIGMLTAPAR